MLARSEGSEKSKSGPANSVMRRLRRDAKGSMAIEFALVSIPFLMFCFSIMGFGFYFFTTTALEYGAETAARQIRTGQAQTGGLTKQQFKQLVCAAAGTFIDCSDSKLKVHIQSAASWAGIVPTPCVSGGSLSASAGTGADAVSGSSGGASQAVVVTVCYEWTLAQAMPFLMLGNMGNGSSIIQAVATFRTEPFQ